MWAASGAEAEEGPGKACLHQREELILKENPFPVPRGELPEVLGNDRSVIC